MTSKELSPQSRIEQGKAEINFRHLSSQFLGGIYRGIPEITVDPSEEIWKAISQNTHTFSGDKETSKFQVMLYESDQETHEFDDETRVAGLAAGKRALVQQQAENKTIAESVIDLTTGDFITRSSSGVLLVLSGEEPAISAGQGSSPGDVAEEARAFARDFVLSTPEYRCPAIDFQISRQTGEVAAASGVQLAY